MFLLFYKELCICILAWLFSYYNLGKWSSELKKVCDPYSLAAEWSQSCDSNPGIPCSFLSTENGSFLLLRLGHVVNALFLARSLMIAAIFMLFNFFNFPLISTVIEISYHSTSHPSKPDAKQSRPSIAQFREHSGLIFLPTIGDSSSFTFYQCKIKSEWHLAQGILPYSRPSRAFMSLTETTASLQ